MPICTKCVKNIDNPALLLLCVDCKGPFHPECTKVESFENFKKLSVRKKAAWKCDTCNAETSSSISLESRGEHEPTLSNLMEAFQSMRNDVRAQITEVKSSVDGVLSQLQEVRGTISSMQATLNTLASENEERKAEFTKLTQENKELRVELLSLNQHVRELEQYSRRDNIEIVGVPISRGEDIYRVLNQIAKILKLQYETRDISVAHRLPLRNGQPHPTIIARFVSREDRTAWMRAAREHRARLTAAEISDTWPSTPIFINEHLTPYNKMILSRAKRLVREKKLAFAWSRDCKIYVKKTSLPECPAVFLRTIDDLDEIFK